MQLWRICIRCRTFCSGDELNHIRNRRFQQLTSSTTADIVSESYHYVRNLKLLPNGPDFYSVESVLCTYETSCNIM